MTFLRIQMKCMTGSTTLITDRTRVYKGGSGR